MGEAAHPGPVAVSLERALDPGTAILSDFGLVEPEFGVGQLYYAVLMQHKRSGALAIYVGRERQEEYYQALMDDGGGADGAHTEMWHRAPTHLRHLYMEGYRLGKTKDGAPGITQVTTAGRSETGITAEIRQRIRSSPSPSLGSVRASGGLYATRQTLEMATAVQASEWHDEHRCLVCGSADHSSTSAVHLQCRLPTERERVHLERQMTELKAREAKTQQEMKRKIEKLEAELKTLQTELPRIQAKLNTAEAERDAARDGLRNAPGVGQLAAAVGNVLEGMRPAAPAVPPPAPPPTDEVQIPPENEWVSTAVPPLLPQLRAEHVRELLRPAVNHKQGGGVPLFEVARRLGAAPKRAAEEDEGEKQKRARLASTWVKEFWPAHRDEAIRLNLVTQATLGEISRAYNRNRVPHADVEALVRIYGRA